MKKSNFSIFVLILMLLIFTSISFSSPIHIYDYLGGKFPTIFSLYLASLDELTTEEKEFVNLVESLPPGEQEAYAREVYQNGFSEDLLNNLKNWQETREAPSLQVAWPWRKEQRIWGSPLYVFGTTDASPAVIVTVNEQEVELFDYRTGNFLTLVEVDQGKDFPIAITACRGGKASSIERSVYYPTYWQEMPEEPLAIHESNLQPREDQILREGNQLRVMCQGSPEVEATFRIGNRAVEIPMEQTTDNLPWPLEGEGIYMGTYTVKEEDVPFHRETEPQSITITLKREDEVVSRELPGKVSFASSLLTQIAEVTNPLSWLWEVNEDSFALNRSTRGGDGLPASAEGYYIRPGTLLEVLGIAGDHLKISLGGKNYLMHDENVKEASYAIKRPFSTLSKIELNETNDEISVHLNTQTRIPFLIEDKPQQLQFTLDGIKKSTPINQVGQASMIKDIFIDFPIEDREDVMALTINLNQPMAGFDYQWEGTELVISMRKPPEIDPAHPLKGRTIVIDPGHGGKYPGAVGPGDVHERDVVLAMGEYLRDMLKENGATVIMTREEDVNVDLYERVNIAVKANADLFISIHANAHAEGADAIAYHGHMTLYNFTYNQKLAEIMLENLGERMGLPKKIVWQRNSLAVLRRPQVPSVLVETGFLMHPEDNWYLLTPKHQKEFAMAMMDGIVDYFLSL
jgi:N-acetylmuramoyl-L-alanine amidase